MHQIKHEDVERIRQAAITGMNTEIEKLAKSVDAVQLTQCRNEIAKQINNSISFKSLFNGHTFKFNSIQ
jgi:hypothetical protein